MRDATAARGPVPASTPGPQAPIELASIVRDSPPLRSPSLMAAEGRASRKPDVVEVPVPRRAPAAPARVAPAPAPVVVAQLPRTGFDVGLMVSAGLALIAAGLMIAAATVAPAPAPRGPGG